MKKLYFFLFALCTISVNAQNKLSKLSTNETSIVFTSFPVINLDDYQENTNSVYSYYQAYKMVSENDLQNRLSTLETLELKAKNAKQNNIVALSILNTDFEVINPEAFNNNKIALDVEGFLVEAENADNIYNKNTLSIAAPLQFSHKGLNVVFNLSENAIFNTTNKNISSIAIDFGNNEGFKTITKNTNLNISYQDKGSKTITTILSFSDGSTTTSQSTIDIKYSNEDLQTLFNRAPIPFTSSNTTAPNLTPYGEANEIGTGEYEIFLSPDGVFDKPIILIDGFDPGDGRDITGLYDLLAFDDNGTSSNLADLVRAEGFDVVILNFPVYTRASDMVEVDGGADFIERNAMLLVELINIINGPELDGGKVGDEELVIIGPSMGGLISRYALNFMENQSMDHETRLWLSFDSPHYGANVPIGFQYLFNKIAYGLQLGGLGGDQSVVSLRPLVDDFLRSPAAKQMLVDHFDAHITSGTDFDTSLMLPQKHPWNPIFYAGLNALTTSGFPENTRKISIVNGSGIGNPYQDKNGMNIEPNFLALDVSNLAIGSGLTASTADFTSRFTPLAGQQNAPSTSSIFIDTPFLCFCGDFNASATVQAETFSNGVDAASGGLFDIGALTGTLGTDPLVTGFLAGLQTDFFNFIPTVSAMALENDGDIDWFHIPNNVTTSSFTVNNITPFDAWYMPDNNEGHVTLTDANVNFALDEIIIRSNLAAKAYLQGPLLGSTDNMMRDDLRVDNYIPTTSPYSDNLITNTTVFNTTGNDAIVDWVFVELRDAVTNTNVIASQSALLQRDGDIVDIDGTSTLPFNNIPGNNYYVAVKHRSHLGIMTNTPISLSRLPTTVDFTDANNQITFGTDAQTTFGVPTNTVAMWSGDSNGDGRINYSGALSDVPLIRSQVFNDPNNSVFGGPPAASFPSLGYFNTDINLDGSSVYSGTASDVLHIRNGIFNNPSNSVFGGPPTSTFLFVQQLPEGANN
ncbi:hypothetical protein [uncultured Lacinutrix sp.]|uniref:hypothetical protein n=1 Tax=uncultured Lacinutrix sp. TaxID=574032 RepID=UPI002611BE2F|nr:hypothetical protein [uncultured Lacinutrix sp.]